MPWITIAILAVAIVAAIAAYHLSNSLHEIDEMLDGDE